jgi:hypothetical protein
VTDGAALVSAFALGLLGSTHCVAMCGGIVGALTLGLPERARRSRSLLIFYLGLYNTGRLLSYAFAGFALGLIGSVFFQTLPANTAPWAAKVISGFFLIAFGLFLTGWWPFLTTLEKWGAHAWRTLEPIGRRLLPVDRPHKALVFGFVWGWLPCGMVYSALALALASGEAGKAGLRMLAFGLGTLPALLLTGIFSHLISSSPYLSRFKQAAGVLILTMGLVTLLMPTGLAWYSHHSPAAHH